MSSIKEAAAEAKKLADAKKVGSEKIHVTPTTTKQSTFGDTEKKINNIFLVLTNQVGIWENHDRGEGWFNEENCADLLSDLPGEYSPEWENWQELPGLVRMIPEGKYPTGHRLANKKYEVIYGGRRLWVCQHKRVKYYLAKVVKEEDGYDDKKCHALMYRENVKRKDTFKMERALSIHKAYKQYWHEGQKTSLEKMAAEYNETTGTLTDYERAGRLFFIEELSVLFKQIVKLPISVSKKLVSAYEQSPDKVKEVIESFTEEFINNTRDSKLAKDIIQLVEDTKKTTKDLYSKKSSEFRFEDVGLLKTTINDKGEVTITLPAAASHINKKKYSEMVYQAMVKLGLRE